MTRVATISILTGCLAALAGAPVSLAATNQAPDFQEVYGLIRAHAAGVSDAELNRAAVQGLVTALGPKVSLTLNGAPPNPPAEIPLLSRTTLFDGDIAYLRVGMVSDGLAAAVRSAYQHVSSTNRLNGLVLDLRYTDGTDYAAAAAVADLFVAKNVPLLNWGEGMTSSHEKTNAVRLPIVVLINHETMRAAEALAALVRQTGTGLILGGATAGQAMVMQDFPLRDGEHLRIATVPIALGNNSTLSAQGIKPDITVAVSPENERAYYADAFVTLPEVSPANRSSSPAGQTNLASVTPRRGRLNEAELVRERKQGSVLGSNSNGPVRMNEAELVREHKEGLDTDSDADTPMPAQQPDHTAPVVTDPALTRALDLLKGLAVMQLNRF